MIEAYAAKRWTLKIQGMYALHFVNSLYVFVVDGLTIDYSNRKYSDRTKIRALSFQ